MGNRPNILGRGQALDGDKTTTGAKLVTGLVATAGSMLERRQIVRGDKTTPCPKCGKVGTVAEGETRRKILSIPAAVDGCLVVCDCPRGSNRIIAPLGWTGRGLSPSQLAQEYHADGLAAAAVAREAEEKRQAEERERNRVFAKSCLRGEGCNDAGDQREPQSNFGEMCFYQAAPVNEPATDADVPQHAQTARNKKPAVPEEVPKPKKRSALWKWWNGNHEEIDYQAAVATAAAATRAQTATAGANVLELIGGRALTYGTWAVRSAEAQTLWELFFWA